MTNTTPSRKEIKSMFTITEIETFGGETVEALALGRSFTSKSGVAAKVVTEGGWTRRVSKLEGETRWTIDGEWPPNRSWPKFWNGRGSRCTMLVPVPAEMGEALDEAVTAA